MQTLGVSDGWLVIFNRRAGRSWDERITWDMVERAGVRMRVIGC